MGRVLHEYCRLCQVGTHGCNPYWDTVDGVPQEEVNRIKGEYDPVVQMGVQMEVRDQVVVRAEPQIEAYVGLSRPMGLGVAGTKCRSPHSAIRRSASSSVYNKRTPEA